MRNCAILGFSIVVFSATVAWGDDALSALAADEEKPVTVNAENVKTNALTEIKKTGTRPAKITADKTYYDHKEGVVFFNRNVWVDDAQFQMHCNKAYVFIDTANELQRIVAIGSVALTNETRRVYGDKVSYYRKDGMVVLYSGSGRPAEVRDVKPEGDNVVKGSKIKLWIDSEQVEVLDAEITGQTEGVNTKAIAPRF